MKKLITSFLATALVCFSQFSQAQISIENDTVFSTASQMFLANELFESGEPFAEELGYDLDLLDPMVADMPDSISYSTGIENYEYSRYLLNTLNGRSGMGLHIMWSPIIMANAAMQPSTFDGMFTPAPNGFKEDDMMMMMIGNFGMNANQTPPAHAFPQFADFMEGNPHLPQTVASDFQMDFATTRWDRAKMDKTLNLGSMGQSMLKQYFWAQDMLGSFHDGNDEDVEPTGSNSPDLPGSPILDPNNDIFYGGNNLDGFIGQVLTAVSINKTAFLINRLAYDGTSLGAVSPATYTPANGIQYFPTKIAVTESPVLTGLPPQASALTVVDATSQLFDQWSYLLATSNYKNMMNPADNSDAAHLAYHEVFDGYPFPAPASVTGMPGPFDLMTGASKVIFLNTMAMHFNSAMGTFVNESSLDANGQPVMGNIITAENAAYMIVTLAKFSEEFAGTPLQSMADNALVAQANFILDKFVDATGGFNNMVTLGVGASSTTKTLATNAAMVRGLYAAYGATNDNAYLTAANDGYNFLINNFYIPAEKSFRTQEGEDLATYTPWNLALLSGMLREASLAGQSNAASIYTRVFKRVYNKMILSEAEATGETGGDSDSDGVPYIAGGKMAFVFAAEGVTLLNATSVVAPNEGIQAFKVFPNPAQDFTTIELNMERPATVNLDVFDTNGRLVISNKNNTLTTGLHHINVSLDGLNVGNYFVRMSIHNKVVAIEKLVIVK